MTARVALARRGTYLDSVRLMGATSRMVDQPGVVWAAAWMATPGNLEELARRGFGADDLDGLGANDLVLSVEAETPGQAGAALAAADEQLAAASATPVERAEASGRRTLRQAKAELPDANLALISVPGAYAALEAHRALSEGLHVLLFSDHVSTEAEVELKARAAELGLLVMGPGAGTAELGGVGLGFANVVRRGAVGVVAAAGTGAQEVMCLLDRWGAGVSHAIGLGGRDLSADVGGRMAMPALRALEADDETEAILLVSKPPAPEVARRVIGGRYRKHVVAALLGLDADAGGSSVGESGVRVRGSLEAAALETVRLLGLPEPHPEAGLAAPAAPPVGRLAPGRTAVRGLFSGGTLCHEAMLLLSRHLGPVHSNVPLHADWSLPAPRGAHRCLDLGEEEFTQGRPHPMIDLEGRAKMLLDEAADPDTAVILVDVVLGYGSHPDPASVLAAACREVGAQPDGPVVVAYVLGTDRDPQGYAGQCEQLERAGCLLAPTAARAALLAAAVASRRPEIAEAPAP